MFEFLREYLCWMRGHARVERLSTYIGRCTRCGYIGMTDESGRLFWSSGHYH